MNKMTLPQKSNLFVRVPALMALSLLLGIAPVSAAPADFSVSAVNDTNTFKLSGAKGHYVALHFLLKTECPYCMKHSRDYAMKAPTVAGVVHIFLKPDTDEEIKDWNKSLNVKGPDAPIIYRDPEAKLAAEFAIPDGYKFHGQTVHFPALVLLDPTGREVFRYVGKNNTDRYSFEKFAAKINELSAATALDQYNLPADKVALAGYDPVGYLESKKALPGVKEITSQYRGVTYQFASEQNRRLFAANPEKYLPTYGGWCATAMAKGKKVEIDPTNFKVTNGRLFLFFNGFFGNAINDWNKDETAQMTKADTNWKKISNE
ncbi:MAG: hypothetical protein JWR19_4050 [Pedosphaera sp.]|nr:hypothetical protein [Pedosphaera sp.]